MDFIKNGSINKNVTDKARNIILKDADKDNNSNKYNNYNLNTKKDKKDKKNNDNISDEENDNYLDNENDDFPKKKKKDEDKDKENLTNKKKNVVKRPIICICNDLYAKVLMNMRKEALIFNIKKANPLKLLNRLKEICILENISLDSRGLKNLCEKSNYDIRVCVNSLEFLSYNKNNLALFKSISNGEKLSILGRKDLTEGVFGIWGKLFTSNLEKLNYNSMMDLYSSHGEYNIINDGLFINYLKVNSKENDYAGRAKLLDYLSYDDTLQKYINTTFNYEMSRFQGIPGAFAKRKFSSTERVNLEFTTTLIELKKQKKENSRIIKAMKTSYQEENNGLKISKKSFVLDLLPFIFQLIQPEIREINTELMNKTELMHLYNSLNLMHNFGIKFNNISHSNNTEDEEIALYEPDIKKLLTFDYNTNSNLRITGKQKLIIKNEYEKYKSFKEAKKIIKGLQNLNFTTDIMEKIKNNKVNFEIDEKEIEKHNKTNFKLGNKRTFTQRTAHNDKFIYKYNEGVTNSVRRSLNISYFLK